MTTEVAVQENNIEKAYFATGCFWGAELNFRRLDGVIDTAVGYMGGHEPNPTYQQVCSGRTGHAEIVEVEFDPAVISYLELLKEFWTMHDPTTVNRQGNDIGSQYRSAIYTSTSSQLKEALATREVYNDVLKKNGLDDICTEIKSSEDMRFWRAEEYHQKYLYKNPNGYNCHSSTGITYPEEMLI
jgi:peptide-methionine (S)-S-oxide reductase